MKKTIHQKPPTNDFTPKEFFTGVLRHWLLIIVTVTLALSGTLLFYMGYSPSYTSTARILLEDRKSALTKISAVNSAGAQSQQVDAARIVRNQVEFLKSLNLARGVDKIIHFGKIPEFIAETKKEDLDVFAYFATKLKIKMAENSNVIEIAYTANTPKLASKMVNIITDVYKNAKINEDVTTNNGLCEDEFYDVEPVADAADFLYIGELRQLKGVDLLINAFAKLSTEHKDLQLIVIGYGPEEDEYKSMVAKAGIYDHVTFLPPTPAADAFKLAKVQVMPSRAEGLPYMILETIAAKMPLIASDVGGIPEIYGENKSLLFASENEQELYDQMKATIAGTSAQVNKTKILQDYVRENFNVKKMSNDISEFYQQ